MENSEMHTKAIRLGNELVKVLELEPGGNTLTKWMAYYLAEQLTLAKTVEGTEKIAAEEKCCKTVLALWQQRGDWPSGRRPFENFEPIFKTLTRLNPDEPRPFFHRLFRDREEAVGTEKAEVIHLMDIVESIDTTARVLIETALESAVETAMSDTTKRLLREALPGKPDEDVQTVRLLLNRHKKEEEGTPEEKDELLIKRLEQLDHFADICKKVRSAYAAELKALRSRSKKTDS